MYQRVRAYRDSVTGVVHVVDRHLGAVTPARPKPLLDQLDPEELEEIIHAWRDGDSVAMIITRVEACTGDPPAPATVFNWMRAHGITRDRTAKQTGAVEAQFAQSVKGRQEGAARAVRQAERRTQALREIEAKK